LCCLALRRAHAADPILSGAIARARAQKLDGITVSAKLEESTITTSVYTDTGGNYYFPAPARGEVRVWRRPLGFERSTATVDLSARREPIHLCIIARTERRYASCRAGR